MKTAALLVTLLLVGCASREDQRHPLLKIIQYGLVNVSSGASQSEPIREEIPTSTTQPVTRNEFK
jgi:hypothetical protein